MTQQFSKLNKIGSTFKSSKLRPKANFTIGQKIKNETSSDSEDEYENSIFQPSISVESGASHYITDSSGDRSIEQGLEATEDNVVDTFLPGVGNYSWFVFLVFRCLSKNGTTLLPFSNAVLSIICFLLPLLMLHILISTPFKTYII